jgi:serine/threonine-protein kinase
MNALHRGAFKSGKLLLSPESGPYTKEARVPGRRCRVKREWVLEVLMSESKSSAADRNLLFGILAVQMNFVSRDALIGAMNSWVLDKARLLGQILLEQKALAADAHQLLEALVKKHLELHDNDAEKSLAAVSSVGSVRGKLQLLADADVQASLAHVGVAGGQVDQFATRAGSLGATGGPGARFRVLRPHARGGLGEVFVARDEELGREVALNEIQDRHADDPASRARFLLEAEITGGLEHPGIVPVYGLGQYADGRPYYAMRFIRGDSLKEAIDRFHQQQGNKPDAGERGVEFRKLLGRFIDICNAIGYAHCRGVLHRDLKPGNIMLGKYGETLVVDWGLAKAADKQEPATEADEAPLHPSAASGTPDTLPGKAIGTPQFMSPEQAAGRHDLLGPASDVYSLGATLYALLTGQVPFTDSDISTVLRRVQQGDFPQPRRVLGSVPKALEAICLKAMALKPQDRYATPRVLADDVEHWLADEPVMACPESWTARLGRWARRHRATVRSAVAALLVALVGTVTATVLLSAANDRERSAKELALKNEAEAKKQRDKARVRFQLAREAVDKFHTQVSESQEMKAKGVEQLRAKLLGTAVDFYQKFTEQEEGNDPAVQRERGHAFWRLANLCDDIGRYGQAEKTYQAALEIQQKLRAEYPDDLRFLSDLAATWTGLGNLYYRMSRYELAEKYDQQAVAARRQIAEAPSATAVSRDELARVHANLANVYTQSNRYDLAEQHYLAAQAALKKLVADCPKESVYQSSLAQCQGNLGVLLSRTGKRGQAEKAFQDCIATYKSLAEAQPDDPGNWDRLAGRYHTLAELYSESGRTAQAEEQYQQALAIRKKLADTHPAVPIYQAKVADSLNGLAGLYHRTGRNDRAESVYQEAAGICRKLADAHPTVTDYQSDVLNSYLNLGELYRQMRQLDKALEAHEAALKIAQRVLASDPKSVDWQVNLGACYHNLGLTHNNMKHPELAAEAYVEAIAVRKPLAEAYRKNPWYRRNLAWSYHNLGDVCLRLNRQPEALQAYQNSLTLAKELTAEEPSVTDHVTILGSDYEGLGKIERDAGHHEAAAQWYSDAVAALAKIMEKNAQDPTARRYQRNAYEGRAIELGQLGRHAEASADWERALALTEASQRPRLGVRPALALARSGDHEHAVAEADALAKGKDNTSTMLYDLLRVYSLSIAAVRKDDGRIPAERHKAEERYAERAIELLGAARAAGHFKEAKELEGLKKDADFDALRQRADFKKLCADWEKPATP